MLTKTRFQHLRAVGIMRKKAPLCHCTKLIHPVGHPPRHPLPIQRKGHLKLGLSFRVPRGLGEDPPAPAPASGQPLPGTSATTASGHRLCRQIISYCYTECILPIVSHHFMVCLKGKKIKNKNKKKEREEKKKKHRFSP